MTFDSLQLSRTLAHFHHVIYVPNSKEQMINAAIFDVLNCWTSAGHKVELVAWDGERSVTYDTIDHLALVHVDVAVLVLPTLYV